MIEEDEATGQVAAVYARLLERSPFVPSLFKSLALCPPYLALAWRQAEPALDGSDLPAAAEALADSVHDAATPPSELEAREMLAGFIGPLGRMLLVSCGLLAALRGELAPSDANRADTLPPPEQPLRRAAPTVWEVESTGTFGRVRAALDTPIINTIWRVAASEGRLDTVWEQLEPQAAPTRRHAGQLQDAALATARRMPWGPPADLEALRATESEDAAPGMAAILDAYVKTLPRVLTLVASCKQF